MLSLPLTEAWIETGQFWGQNRGGLFVISLCHNGIRLFRLLLDVREVTGSSPVSSTTKTALFERKERFFLTFSHVLQCAQERIFALTTVLATDREKFTLRETLVPEGVGLF